MGMFKYGAMAIVGAVALITRGGSIGDGQVEKVIDRPTSVVYAAVSNTLIDSPVQTMTSSDGGTTRAQYRIDRNGGKLVEVMMLDDKPAFTSTYSFSDANGGKSTKVTVNYVIDTDHVRSTRIAKDDNKTAISESEFESQIEQNLAKIVKGLEGGYTSAPSRTASAFENTSRGSSYDRESRGGSSYARRHAAPMASAAPMVDPNAVARAHVRGDSYE